ncbi:DUF4175 domain-containing protein [Oceaniglobus indicus]|uniref:DUF4175 domain-containing protein n=1 Tax=Oceaniglobus indicus TaxID=2047749 RepID=UPI000C176803|nr:DUF4175 domain-containing protein [Oceaniglobus indicus]
MSDPTRTSPAMAALRRPMRLTLAGLWAERITRCFWPVWSVLMAAIGALMLGLHDVVPVEVTWGAGIALAAAVLGLFANGLRRFAMPTWAEARDLLDATLPGRPIQTIGDTQAIGAGDPASEAVWRAHIARMTARLRAARAVRPDLRIAARDPFALRYAALLILAVAVVFGSVWRIASVAHLGPGAGQAQAAGPSWEGWIEPPAYTGKPSLYLADLSGTVEVPQDSRMTVRLYGEIGRLTLDETVSGGGDDPAGGEGVGAPEVAQSFQVRQSGRVEISGPGGRRWDVVMRPDLGPAVAAVGPAERKADGEFRQPFAAEDDYGVQAGKATITLDLAAVDRTWGLTAEPDARDAIVVDLAMPITGNRTAFEQVLVDDFSRHPWANLPVTIRFEVTDALGQIGQSAPVAENLGGLRFFDPMAKAIVEQRRDLLWAKSNAPRVAQVLRAVSWVPQDVFRSQTTALKLRRTVERLETHLVHASLSGDVQDAIAEDLWALAEQLEYGDLADAMERLKRARERLEEAMRNGASDEEIAALMQELREATQDYMQQLAEQSEDGDQAPEGETQEITQDQIQQMMDRIQELMEQGRMAEAQQLLEQLQQLMENMQVTQGQGGEGQQGAGERATQELRETLRDQQDLSDEAFRDLQEQFDPGAGQGDRGEAPGPQGDGQSGTGTMPEGQGQGQGRDLADRQRALRDELNRQRGTMPGAGTPEGDAARDALGRADRAMEGAEQALRDGDNAAALDRQSDAMEALREGIRNLDEAEARTQGQPGQEQRGETATRGDSEGRQRDPLGREAGAQGQIGSDQPLPPGEDVYRRAEELLGEIRRRSGDRTRSEQELDYLKRLLDRF